MFRAALFGSRIPVYGQFYFFVGLATMAGAVGLEPTYS